ncbi:hypothetical protein [Clostridium septicum]|uniref:Uncharacterized protein n=1 Tax=Clostridium septicum TaxID=1504 RepID=A0A9N7PMN3_CLOSE|nr:hypothetical protein [Clostridium septicum]AYE35357.1 hypothetical protein CP523_13480 [Clostridium septicum]MDU1315078.1 hypothetical protein [Clostridium septicum]QAS60748.1 hypothetical protein EI377_08380 [Clostridium septicum]UEC19986.1 hypothetical protein LK444_11290 [Clostridium septicum]USS01956.1 hypothetical protein NH397_05880 [Clostridium septicum]
MNITEILNILDENNLSEIEELRSEEDLLLVKFYFDFDEDVLNAAKAYANEESDYEFESIEWIKEYFIPYLYDFANDEVLSIIEEIVDELDVSGEIMAFQMDSNNSNYVQFMALFTNGLDDITIEEVVKDFI